MALHPALEAFRDWITAEYRPDASYEAVRVLEGADANGDLAVRLEVGGRSYYEARVDLEKGEVQAGFATESRVVNEAVEQMVLDNGGSLDEFLGDELSDLGEQPLPAEHFFERPAFRFIVRMPLSGPEQLEDAALRKQVKAVLQASRVLFQDSVDGS